MSGSAVDIAVRPAVRADLPRMVEVLDRAFRTDDPFGEYMFPDPARRARNHPRLTRAMIRHQYLPAGGAHVATVDGRIVGASLEQGPDYRFGPLRYLASIPEFVWAMGAGGPRALAVDAAIAKLAPGLPHVFGVTLGVDPDHQGTGAGFALARACLERVSAARVPLLGLAKDGNVAYYRGYGARVVGRIRLGRKGPEVNVLMWLPPEPAGTANAPTASPRS